MAPNLTKSLQTLADSVVYAETTLSEYYKIGCIKVRFSDHMATDMDCDLAIFSNTIGKRNVYIVIPTVGTFKEVQWFTNVDSVIDFIINFEQMARLMIKAPTHNDNQHERQEANKLVKTLDTSKEKVNYGTWKQKLGPIYNTKNGELEWIADDIYKLGGTADIFKKMLHATSYKFDNKVRFLNDLLVQLKQQHLNE